MDISEPDQDEEMVNVSDKPTVKSLSSTATTQSKVFHPRKADFNECWAKIEEVVMSVMRAQPCTTKRWDDCFFDIYALCTSTSGNIVQLYAVLTKFYINFVDEIRTRLETLQGIDLIEAYASSWSNYSNGVNHIHKLCNYLNKLISRDFTWKLFCRDHPDLTKHIGENTLHVSALSRKIWQSFLLIPLKDHLYMVIHDEFVNARQQNYIAQPATCVRLSLESFIDVCFPSDNERDTLMNSVESGTFMTNRTPSPEKLKFYEEFFESRFLHDTEVYFKNSNVVQDQNQSMYTKMAASATILENETRLCKALLFLPTVEKTLKLLRMLFVLGPMDRFVNVLPAYVGEERKTELNLAYKLLSPFKEEGLNFLVQEYENHVARTLNDQINPAKLTPASFVEVVCAKHQYFQQFADEVFEGSQDLNDGYRRAVESVVNDASNREPFYAAKMIAKHMDLLLKRSSRNKVGEDLEDKMDEAITVFRFIKDKDTFLKIYQRLFSNRLLSKMFSSLQNESMMIEKLKSACGNDYTNKLVRMYTDFENSKQLSEEFFKNQSCSCKHREEDEITVIQTCAWPVTSSKEDPNLASFNVPLGLQPYTECFKKFYEGKHNGRILNYAYHVSTADLLFSLGARQSTVTMTVPQAILLLSYNSNDQLTIGQLAENSGLTFEYICSCLKALLELKILKASAANKDFYTPETAVSVNLEFSAQRSRFHLPPPTSMSRAPDTTNIIPSQQETAQDRKAVIECAIVRAMKTRKVIQHKELVDLIHVVTDNRFIPDNQSIKRCIEGLIEKHFIQRTGVDSYEYLA